MAYGPFQLRLLFVSYSTEGGDGKEGGGSADLVGEGPEAAIFVACRRDLWDRR